jgi:hypothetical protein
MITLKNENYNENVHTNVSSCRQDHTLISGCGLQEAPGWYMDKTTPGLPGKAGMDLATPEICIALLLAQVSSGYRSSTSLKCSIYKTMKLEVNAIL